MLCKIADLIIDVPDTGGMPPRCREYAVEAGVPDIVILEERYNRSLYSTALSDDDVAYMESAYQFYVFLLNYGGLMLHSSAVELDGKAYLFSGHSGVGKSTHTCLWKQCFGEAAQIFNDDKPALRLVDGRWYAYGTPWCGKDGINQNKKVPLAGICFLTQGTENSIRRLSDAEAVQKLISQTIRWLKGEERLDRMLALVDSIVREIPVYELVNKPEPQAAYLSYETMRTGAEEFGL